MLCYLLIDRNRAENENITMKNDPAQGTVGVFDH